MVYVRSIYALCLRSKRMSMGVVFSVFVFDNELVFLNIYLFKFNNRNTKKSEKYAQR